MEKRETSARKPQPRNERALQDWIVRYARQAGVLCVKTAAIARRGWPDLQLIYQGRIIFAEVKHPLGTGRVSKHQERIHRELLSHQMDIRIIADIESAKRMILDITETT